MATTDLSNLVRIGIILMQTEVQARTAARKFMANQNES